MARLGKGKMERWERDLLKAQTIIQKVDGEARAVLLAAKGGRQSQMVNVCAMVRTAIQSTRNAGDAVTSLAEGEARRKPKAATPA